MAMVLDNNYLILCKTIAKKSKECYHQNSPLINVDTFNGQFHELGYVSYERLFQLKYKFAMEN